VFHNEPFQPFSLQPVINGLNKFFVMILIHWVYGLVIELLMIIDRHACTAERRGTDCFLNLYDENEHPLIDITYIHSETHLKIYIKSTVYDIKKTHFETYC
jgi:hypothetical protein